MKYYSIKTVSKPHFLDADPSLLEKVKGLVPNEEKYDIIADFELVSDTYLAKTL